MKMIIADINQVRTKEASRGFVRRVVLLGDLLVLDSSEFSSLPDFDEAAEFLSRRTGLRYYIGGITFSTPNDNGKLITLLLSNDVIEKNTAGSVLDAAEVLWQALGDVPQDREGNLDGPFLHFPKGTSTDRVWGWFESTFELSVAEDLMKLNTDL